MYLGGDVYSDECIKVYFGKWQENSKNNRNVYLYIFQNKYGEFWWKIVVRVTKSTAKKYPTYIDKLQNRYYLTIGWYPLIDLANYYVISFIHNSIPTSLHQVITKGFKKYYDFLEFYVKL